MVLTRRITARTSTPRLIIDTRRNQVCKLIYVEAFFGADAWKVVRLAAVVLSTWLEALFLVKAMSTYTVNDKTVRVLRTRPSSREFPILNLPDNSALRRPHGR
jgi:hypothetical protein